MITSTAVLLLVLLLLVLLVVPLEVAPVVLLKQFSLSAELKENHWGAGGGATGGEEEQGAGLQGEQEAGVQGEQEEGQPCLSLPDLRTAVLEELQELGDHDVERPVQSLAVQEFWRVLADLLQCSKRALWMHKNMSDKIKYQT